MFARRSPPDYPSSIFLVSFVFLSSLLFCLISTVLWSGATSICDGIIFFGRCSLWHLTFDMTEGSDSTDAYDIGTILSHFHWWILRLSAIQKNYQSLTDWLNNIGLRDASASKNKWQNYLFKHLLWSQRRQLSFKSGRFPWTGQGPRMMVQNPLLWSLSRSGGDRNLRNGNQIWFLRLFSWNRWNIDLSTAIKTSE